MQLLVTGDLEPNEFYFHFETNDAVRPDALGRFLQQVERVAHLRRHFGPDAEVRLLEIGTGSVWGKIAIAVGVLGSAAGFGSFVLDLETRMRSPTDPLAQAIATMSLDSSVVSAKIVTKDRVIEVHTIDMPAVASVKQARAALAHEVKSPPAVNDPARVVNLPLHGRVPGFYPKDAIDERVQRRYLVGELHPANPGGSMPFITDAGIRYELINTDTIDYLGDFPFGKRVILEASATETEWRHQRIEPVDLHEIG